MTSDETSQPWRDRRPLLLVEHASLVVSAGLAASLAAAGATVLLGHASRGWGGAGELAVKFAAAVAAIPTALLAWGRFELAKDHAAVDREKADIDRARLDSERFGQAIAQLGSDKPEVVLGGLYALEALGDAARSVRGENLPSYHSQIIEVLCALVRTQTQDRVPADQGATAAHRTLTEAEQSALTILGRHPTWGNRVDLHRSGLSLARLTRASLVGASLAGADLAGADLAGADLTGADLTAADLTDADLTDATLAGATLTKGNLTRTILTSADLSKVVAYQVALTRATLMRSILTGANLTGANLAGANLTDAQLIGAALISTDFTDANIVGADFTDANVTGALVDGVRNRHLAIGFDDTPSDEPPPTTAIHRAVSRHISRPTTPGDDAPTTIG